jgi:hypothetical protein
MSILQNQAVFTRTAGAASSDVQTTFRDNDDFSTEVFGNEEFTAPSLPQNVGIVFVKTSESPQDIATISLNGNDTSTVYIDNTAGSANLNVTGIGSFAGGVIITAPNNSKWKLVVDNLGNLTTTPA